MTEEERKKRKERLRRKDKDLSREYYKRENILEQEKIINEKFQENKERQGAENPNQRFGQSIASYRQEGNDIKEHIRMYTFFKRLIRVHCDNPWKCHDNIIITL